MFAVSVGAEYVSPGQAAKLLGVTAKTVGRWANEGRIPCVVTLGGHRRFRTDVIHAVAVSMGLADESGEPNVTPG